MFLKYLAKMDLILMLSKFSGHADRSEVQMFCVLFNNLTGLTCLAVLMESALRVTSHAFLCVLFILTVKTKGPNKPDTMCR